MGPVVGVVGNEGRRPGELMERERGQIRRGP